MILTYKYALKTRHSDALRQYARAVNRVWNFCVLTQRKIQRNYREGLTSRWPGKFDLCDLTSGTCDDLGLMSQTIQGVCKQFVKSRNTHKRCPKFRKSKGANRSLGWVPFEGQTRKVTSESLTYAGKTYRLFGAKRRPLPNTAKGGVFVEDARGRWYVCFHVEVADVAANGIGRVGLDLGLKTIVTTSDGLKVEAPQFYRRLEENLAVAQRAGNVKRARAINAKIKNQRSDFLHKLSTQLVTNYAAIYVGDVNANALGQTRLAKSVYDAGWSSLRYMLRYKASRHGVTYVEVDESFSTQICSSCGALPPERPRGITDLGIREWGCSGCGAYHDRDINAARNILAFGRSASPLAEGIRTAESTRQHFQSWNIHAVPQVIRTT